MSRKTQGAGDASREDDSADGVGIDAGPLEAFALDFIGDVPHDAAAGSYSAHVRDRWHERDSGIPPGSYELQGWRFSFGEAGAFLAAEALPDAGKSD